MTPEQIATTAQQIRDAGLPDFCNRWLAMTPEAWAANEAARKRIARQVSRQEVRRVPKAERRRSTLALGHAADLDDAGRELLKAQRKEAERKTRERLRSLRERAMTKVGSKENAVRALRTESVADSPTTTAAEPERPTEQQESTVSKKTTKKAARSNARTKVKPEPKTKAATEKTSGVRPGSKLETIVGLLKRPQGCTTKEVLAATGWPAVSMPQQAKAAGLSLTKEKVDGVTRYKAA